LKAGNKEKEQQTISQGKVKQSWRTNSLSFSDLGSDRLGSGGIGWDRVGIGIGIGHKGQAKGPRQTKECVDVDEDGHKSAPMR